MAKKSPQPTPAVSAEKAPHIYELIIQQHQTTLPTTAIQSEIIVTFGGSAFYTYPYRTE